METRREAGKGLLEDERPLEKMGITLESGDSSGLPLPEGLLHFCLLVPNPSSSPLGLYIAPLQAKTEEANKDRIGDPLIPVSCSCETSLQDTLESSAQRWVVGRGSSGLQAIRWYMSGENLRSIMKQTKRL